MKKSILQRMAQVEPKGNPGVPSSTEEGTTQIKRHSSPVISNVGKALSQLGEESIVSLDPRKVERSPYQDRFEDDGDATDALDALSQSIKSEGQKIPVLVRPHPSKPGHYQLAYGRRRLAAISLIMEEAERPETVKIKAYVRDLSDRQLVEEQSIENGVRENLTWIEQAMWACQLKDAGLTHRNMCPVLGLSEVGVSQLFRVTSAIPEDIIYAIGRAKSVGRPKWTELAEILKDGLNLNEVREAIASSEFREADGQGRIAIALRIAAARHAKVNSRPTLHETEFSMGEKIFGTTKHTSKGVTLMIPKDNSEFADWLIGRMPQLVEEFTKNPSSNL